MDTQNARPLVEDVPTEGRGQMAAGLGVRVSGGRRSLVR